MSATGAFFHSTEEAGVSKGLTVVACLGGASNNLGACSMYSKNEIKFKRKNPTIQQKLYARSFIYVFNTNNIHQHCLNCMMN